jgi:queuosine precursor transporter
MEREIVGSPPQGYSRWFILLTAIFITSLVTANIIAVKLISIFGYVLPAAIIVFPISYIAGDVLTEVYGYAKARQVIWLGFLCNLITVVAVWCGQMLPAAPFWHGQEAYELILGYTPRLLAASFAAYLVGEFANSLVLAKMKIATKGRWLWTRTIGSTIVGQGLDSLVFISLAFLGAVPLSSLGAIIVTQWLAKSCYEATATPLTYVVVNFLKRGEGIDVYDYETNFNPLAITNSVCHTGERRYPESLSRFRLPPE